MQTNIAIPLADRLIPRAFKTNRNWLIPWI